MFYICLTECGILSAITCQWAFWLLSVSASDALSPDTAIKTNKNREINTKQTEMSSNLV